MRRTVIRIATGALFVLCCFFFASIINDISASMLTPGPSRVATKTEPAIAAAPSLADRQQILERNLFGSRTETEAIAVVEIEPEEELEETRLPVKLLGTVASKDPQVARAAIANRSGSEHQIVQVGDTLEKHPQAEVVAIDPRRVVLENGNRREELSLEDDALTLDALNLEAQAKRAVRGAKSGRAQPPRRPKRAPQRAAAIDRGKVNQLQKLAEIAKAARPGPGPLSDVKFTPKFEENEMVGVELSSVETGSFLEKLGLKDGDLISQVNGVVIDNPKAGQEVLNALTQNQELTAVVNGEPITVSSEQLTKIRQ